MINYIYIQKTDPIIGVHQPLYSGSSGCKRIQNPLKSNSDSEGGI